MNKTKIEWTEYSWNPVTGCTPISEGCQNCYAKRMANRLKGRFGYSKDEPFKVTLHPERLEEPFKWKKTRRVFVCSMGDLFHEDVPFDFIDQVFAMMSLCEQHTFLLLTKRPQRLLEYMNETYTDDIAEIVPPGSVIPEYSKWPLPNVWIGVTAENQRRANERIPILLQIPAKVRFVSVEPILETVDLTQINTDIKNITINALTGVPYDWDYGEWQEEDSVDSKIDWVICGGETGPHARPIYLDWVRSLRDQCKDADVPFFFKQWGGINKSKTGRILDGRIWDEMPEG